MSKNNGYKSLLYGSVFTLAIVGGTVAIGLPLISNAQKNHTHAIAEYSRLNILAAAAVRDKLKSGGTIELSDTVDIGDLTFTVTGKEEGHDEICYTTSGYGYNFKSGARLDDASNVQVSEICINELYDFQEDPTRDNVPSYINSFGDFLHFALAPDK